ncbi:DUF29 domain-containing protein [Roseofilum casamattae]|uniref:DUF29 domain-containing protein n=1 Tax=Roseofilum casamattae BLCC-M143 TaxID=3022442 RepID=A0ABT7BYA0_9CYAN|nr:DUF29 domain-containing protein [Roseofilum casamattae]MDJ1184170.1 DUF29 domain-containing protein [Roseofilum casamattae BLCC-M143]
MSTLNLQNLYEQDFALWVESTVARLKDGNLEVIDLEHLIDEVESLAKRDRRELKHRLITLFEHLLKRQYVPLPDCYRGWEITIKRTQFRLRDILADSPSLWNFLAEIYLDCYAEACDMVQMEYDRTIPEVYSFTEEIPELLDYFPWENNNDDRHSERD